MTKERDVVGGRGIVLQVFQTNVQWTDVDGEGLLKLAEEEVEVMGGERQLRGLDASG